MENSRSGCDNTLRLLRYSEGWSSGLRHRAVIPAQVVDAACHPFESDTLRLPLAYALHNGACQRIATPQGVSTLIGNTTQ
jgi:hypothetical protein